ncbi:glycosyltransferase [Prochlorococcus sp. AH-736-E15]|nr:glycosyltransferase [Prochlorococcus sp. AH-736-E15]
MYANKITIITVTLNAKSDLLKTISSVQNQNYRNFEHIIKDADSTDGTREINFDAYDNIFFYSNKDKGTYDGMNIAFRFAKGDLVMFLNAGDVLFDNNVLNLINNNFLNNPLSSCLIGYTAQVNFKNVNNFKLLGYGWAYRKLPFVQYPHPSFVLRKNVAEKVQPLFDPSLSIASDYKQQLILRKRNLFKPIFVDKIFTLMPIGGKSTENIAAYLKGFLEVCILSFRLYKLRFVLILFSKVVVIIYKNLNLSKYPKDINKIVIKKIKIFYENI